jgi:hypothetical protein
MKPNCAMSCLVMVMVVGVVVTKYQCDMTYYYTSTLSCYAATSILDLSAGTKIVHLMLYVVLTLV